MPPDGTKDIMNKKWIEKDNEENSEKYEGVLLADGFEEALIGIASLFNRNIAVYHRPKCIEILMIDMNQEDAEEYFEFNVAAAYVGEQTPAFLYEMHIPSPDIESDIPFS